MEEMITAIIQSYRRPANVYPIVRALREQTIKPERIVIWNDNDGSGKFINDINEEIINTNTNYNGNWGAFLYTFLADSKYIACVDDDCPPARNWFKFCVRNQEKTPGIYGRFGIVLKNDGLYRTRGVCESTVGDLNFMEVDMVGHSYFFPKEAVLPMFSVRPPVWKNIVDLHFSFAARKAGWKLYVPTVENPSQLPLDKSIKLPLGNTENAMFTQPGHLERRDEYVAWAHDFFNI